MGLCTLQEIKQIDRLRVKLGVAPVCKKNKNMVVCTLQEIHQIDRLRLNLVHQNMCANPGGDGEVHYIIGYCQGLFNKETENPSRHTNDVTKHLESIDAPMPTSHELFIGLKPERMSIKQYLTDAMMPLKNDGRVPIIITHYDPARDMKEIQEVVTTNPPVSSAHTILVRVQLSSRKSISPAAQLIAELYEKSKKDNVMPMYWPLIQADNFSREDWNAFEKAVGEDMWPYVTVATTPFMNPDVIESIKDNIAVYQFFVGRAADVKENGDVTVPLAACVGEGSEQLTYNLIDYSRTLKSIVGSSAVVGIVCGQSQNWNQSENLTRVKKYVGLLNSAVKILWGRDLKEKTVKPYYNEVKIPS